MISHRIRLGSLWPRDGAVVAGPVAVQVGLIIGYVWALFALRSLPEAQSNPALCLLYAPVEIISTVMAWLAARSATGRMRRGWQLIAVGMGCSAFVNLDWVWLALDPTHHFSWPIYIVAYAQYPLAFWAFASFPRAGSDEVDGPTHLLDAAIVLVAAAVLAWHFIFGDILEQTGAGALATTHTGSGIHGSLPDRVVRRRHLIRPTAGAAGHTTWPTDRGLGDADAREHACNARVGPRAATV